MAALSISPNCYDDLAARFEISAEEIARLRAAHLLHYRDDNGAQKRSMRHGAVPRR